MSKYICSDIHGQYGLFIKMIRGIKFSDNDILYIDGDMIDRGPNSVKILQYVMQHDNIKCIMGNHELMMYVHYRMRHKRDYWLYECNGGIKTLKQFEKLPEKEQKEILNYIENMYLQIELEENGKAFVLSHSDFIEKAKTIMVKNMNYNIVFDVVWNSPWRYYEYVPLSKYEQDGRIHIIGHVPVQSVEQYLMDGESSEGAYIDEESNIINIDLGCARKLNAKDTSDGKCLCCMNITEYAKGNKKNAFRYFR